MVGGAPLVLVPTTTAAQAPSPRGPGPPAPAPVPASGGSEPGQAQSQSFHDIDWNAMAAWHKKTRHPTDYKKLTKDEYWPKWILHFNQRAQEDEFHHVLVSTNSYTQCRPGLGQDLWNRQECFLGLVLEFTLETDMGVYLFTTYQKCPRNVFFKLQEYHCSSPSSLLVAQDIITQLHSLEI